MEHLIGKRSASIDAALFAAQRRSYNRALIDLGTGDGRYVQQLARADPSGLYIGIDACRENLRATSRHAPPNAIFVIANAYALPHELNGVAAHLTINFPWGSLLHGLLHGDPALLESIDRVVQPTAPVTVRLNSGALIEAGCGLDDGAALVRQMLIRSGFTVAPPIALDAAALRRCPTTWAKRLAFGRDPRAIELRAVVSARQAVTFPTGATRV